MNARLSLPTASTVHRAYERLPVDRAARAAVLAARLEALLELSREVESPLLRELKPTIVLSLKWKFDVLACRR